MLIQNGELLTGTLCKKTLGASGGSLIHVIWMEEGPEAARAFLSQTQYLVNHWLLQHGFSIGIGDTVADAQTMYSISDIIAKVSLLSWSDSDTLRRAIPAVALRNIVLLWKSVASVSIAASQKKIPGGLP